MPVRSTACGSMCPNEAATRATRRPANQASGSVARLSTPDSARTATSLLPEDVHPEVQQQVVQRRRAVVAQGAEQLRQMAAGDLDGERLVQPDVRRGDEAQHRADGDGDHDERDQPVQRTLALQPRPIGAGRRCGCGRGCAALVGGGRSRAAPRRLSTVSDRTRRPESGHPSDVAASTSAGGDVRVGLRRERSADAVRPGRSCSATPIDHRHRLPTLADAVPGEPCPPNASLKQAREAGSREGGRRSRVPLGRARRRPPARPTGGAGPGSAPCRPAAG